MAVMTNCALIGMNPEVQKLLPSNMTAVNVVIVFVIVEVFMFHVSGNMCSLSFKVATSDIKKVHVHSCYTLFEIIFNISDTMYIKTLF